MDYEIIIGIEIHVELNTKTKIFCGCENKFGAEPNTYCCPICIGMPGTLPILNKKVIEYAIAVGLSLNCSIIQEISFDRKNYFYPDLPKSYQISQLYFPICRDGYLDINNNKRIRIHEIHIEEDAGKLIHDKQNNCTLIDYNRCGVPLLEIVSEADMRSSEDVISYIENLKSIIEYLGVSDCKMEQGSIRADINISVKKCEDDKLGVRTEIKNMNSFKSIVKAIEYESKRQIELLKNGNNIIQQTLRWDDTKNAVFSMRIKENTGEYRYFPEPDIPIIKISQSQISNIKFSLPEMPFQKKIRYIKDYNISEYEADIIISSKYLADIFEKVTVLCKNYKEIANLIIGDVMRMLKQTCKLPEDITFSPENIAKLISLVQNGVINKTIAKEIFDEIFLHNINPDIYVEKNNLSIIKDNNIIRNAINKIIENNPNACKDYIEGNDRAFKFFMGQIMKELKGRADPTIINNALKEILDHTLT